MKTFFDARCAAIVIMAAGYGWAGGHYIPLGSNLFAYVFQFIILGILLILGLKFFSSVGAETNKSNWAVKGLSIFSVLFFTVNVLNIVHGVVNADPHSFGSHNTFEDLVPIVIILVGSLLWIITILPFRKSA